MQCQFCGEHFPGQFTTCPGCGAPNQPTAPPPSNGNSNKVFIVLVSVLAGVVIIGALVSLIVFNRTRSEKPSAAAPVTTAANTAPPQTAAAPQAAAKPTPATEDTVLVPDVTGAFSNDAIRYLTQAGLTYEIILTESGEVAADAVIQQSPAAQTAAPKGGKVTFYVAKPVAPPPTTAPAPQTQPPATIATAAATEAPSSACPYLIAVKPPVYIFASPSHDSEVVMTLDGDGVYTIVEEDTSNGWWGKLKSGVGWVDMTDILANGGYIME